MELMLLLSIRTSDFFNCSYSNQVLFLLVIAFDFDSTSIIPFKIHGAAFYLVLEELRPVQPWL